ncbi:MAG: ammonium transporter [Nitrospirae bacterium]|nr:ammonium transporter [Nitrospirota bacterium]
MNKTRYLIWLGIATAAGTAMGMLSDRKHPAKGSLLGATAGMVAGSVAAGVYEYISSEKVPYYSTESSLYDDIDSV